MSKCPRDTNGDGDCGQALCPECGTSPDALRLRGILAAPLDDAVPVERAARENGSTS